MFEVNAIVQYVEWGSPHGQIRHFFSLIYKNSHDDRSIASAINCCYLSNK